MVLESDGGSAQNFEVIQLEGLQRRIRQKIENRRYLLILDNVWNEDRYKWLELRPFLSGGAKGSRILVTTRSFQVAKIMDESFVYKLNCLSDDHALSLLMTTAVNSNNVADWRPELVEIGKEIVKKCANVPLAVKMVGSILFGEEKDKWLLVRDTELANISNDWEEKVMYTLRLSYQHLSSPLKRCFTFCALYPKDYAISKEQLSNVWMSNGCIAVPPQCDSRRFEDVCDEYHYCLSQRNFFQEHQVVDGYLYFKLHDLVLDLAKNIAGQEFGLVNSQTRQLNKKVRHISLDCHRKINQFPSYAFESKKLRTLINHISGFKYQPITKVVGVDTLISSYKSLRYLDLQTCSLRTLPDSIGSLALLRYLNLSHNSGIKNLPDSVTKLWNLQSLLLISCSKLKELPKGLGKLVNLWRLDVSGCNALTHMPSGIGNLKNLCTLGMFVVSSPKLKDKASSLNELKHLKHLKGSLILKFHAKSQCQCEEAEYIMTSMEKLTTLEFKFSINHSTAGNLGDDMEILHNLKPHPNLKQLKLSGYGGERFPSWVPDIMQDLGSVLPNLVSLSIQDIPRLKNLPALSCLRCLKILQLCQLPSLDYIEQGNMNTGAVPPPQLPSSSTTVTPSTTVFYPCLEVLSLKELPKLKGWWRESTVPVDASEELLHHSFPCLSKLSVTNCPQLISLPCSLSPLEELSLVKTNDNLSITWAAAQTSSPLTSLKSFATDDIHFFVDMPWKVLLGGLSSLRLESCDEALSCCSSTTSSITNEEVVAAIESLPASLEKLEFISCPEMSTLPNQLSRLRFLKELVIFSCSRFVGDQDDAGDVMMPWKDFQNLVYLEFRDLPQLVTLPVGIQFITTLQRMSIARCPKLKEIPSYIGSDIMLNKLVIFKCPLLVERCKEPKGNDWPKIQHVPYLYGLEQ